VTEEAKKLKCAFEKEAKQASEAIDAAMAVAMAATPIELRQQSSGERGAVALIARDIVDAAATMRTRIEVALRGRGVREVRS